MAFDIKMSVAGSIKNVLAERTALAKGGLFKAAALGGRRVVDDLRADTAPVLGQGVANAWRNNVYPKTGSSWEPAAYIYTKAPLIISSFENGALITGKSGNWLAIPTENVPRNGHGGKPMTPVEVEGRYNVELALVPSLSRPGTALLVMPAVRSTSKKGWRQPTSQRLASGRNLQRIVMFVLVKQVRLAKRLNVAGIAAKWQAMWPEVVAQSLAQAFSNEP